MDNLLFKQDHTVLVGQEAHQGGTYLWFLLAPLGVFLLTPGWDASPSQGYLQH